MSAGNGDVDDPIAKIIRDYEVIYIYIVYVITIYAQGYTTNSCLLLIQYEANRDTQNARISSLIAFSRATPA